MNISFSFNHAEALALNETRYYEIYFTMRSYDGVPIGVHWSTKCLRASLEKLRVNPVWYGEGQLEPSAHEWRIRGLSHDCDMTWHAIEVHEAFVDLKIHLGYLHRGECKASDVMKITKKLRTLLDATEW